MCPQSRREQAPLYPTGIQFTIWLTFETASIMAVVTKRIHTINNNLHINPPTLEAVAVKYGWKASDSHDVVTSPLKPICENLWFPSPPHLEIVSYLSKRVTTWPLALDELYRLIVLELQWVRVKKIPPPCGI